MQEFVFENDGEDFSALDKAKTYLRERGYSIGSMQRDAPIGFMKGEWSVAKWRNLSDAEKQILDGQIIPEPDFRHGNAVVQINETQDTLNFERDLHNRTAQTEQINWEPFWESISKLPVSERSVTKNENAESHFERSPGSYWGGKEVEDGITFAVDGKVVLQGQVRVPSLMAQDELKKAIESELNNGWNEFGTDAFPQINSEIVDEIGQTFEMTGISFNLLDSKIVDADSVICEIKLEVEFEAQSFKSKEDLRREWEDRWS